MNSESDKKGRRIYDDETEDDDDDTRSIISTDSEASKNTITTDNSDTYIEDFDNKSEKEFTQDKLEDVTDDMLFNMDDENTEPDEPNDVDVIDNSKEEEKEEDKPEIQEISDTSSLLIQYDSDTNGELSIPYGIYKECHKTQDGNSFCLEKELTNNTDIEKEVNEIGEEIKDEEIKDEEIKDEEIKGEKKEEAEENELFEEIKNNERLEEDREDNDKYKPIIKKKSKGTKKKSNKHKRFDYTKKNLNMKHRRDDGSKKRRSRNKKKVVGSKNTRRR